MDRQKLINMFLSNKENSSEMMGFLRLENMGTNITEEEDLKKFADLLRVSMKCFDEAWDLLYAFDTRVHEEKLLEKTVS